jgi:Cu-Zn family superoxide dismutase
MKKTLLLTTLITAALSLSTQGPSAAASTPTPTATPAAEESISVDLKDAKGASVGTAWITEKSAKGDKGISIRLDLHGLPQGTHAIHIHEKASCTGPDFKSAGGHFSPGHKMHGELSKNGPHAGDLKNIEVAADGTLKTTLEDHHADLGPALKSLQQGAGTSLIIHAKADDYKTQPSGDSGDRIACGEIKPLAK